MVYLAAEIPQGAKMKAFWLETNRNARHSRNMEQGTSDEIKRQRLKNLHLLRLIQGKRECHYVPDIHALQKGFRGWHERGYLPHFDAPGVTQFLTIMLHDSFPVTRRREWEPLLKEANSSKRRAKLEAWLDRGHGRCWLRRPQIAALVEEELRGEDGNLTACKLGR